jgi:hypothetical protein
MIDGMAGKAPLLLASVLFAVGAVGLALTSADQASWGPFEPRPPQAEQRVIIVDVGGPAPEIPSLVDLLLPPPTAPAVAEPETAPQASAAQPAPQPTATPVPPLKIFGISSDDGGVSAAAATPATPPPLRIVNVASDDDGEPGAAETPAPEASPAAED